jgi:hypothetical protein
MKRIKTIFLLCALLLVFSCGDNNSGYDARHYYFEGVYPNLAFGSELILVYNGDTLTNKKVDFTTHRGIANGILTFENVIPNEAKTVLTVVLNESTNPENTDIFRLLFEGVYATKSRSFHYYGFIEGMLLFLDIKEK